MPRSTPRLSNRIKIDRQVARTRHISRIRIQSRRNPELVQPSEEVDRSVPSVMREAHIDRPIVTMKVDILATGVLFGDGVRLDRSVAFALLEVRQHVVPAPAWVSQLHPVVVVCSAASIPQHAIEESASAQSAALRDGSGIAVEIGLWDGGEVPVVAAADVVANKTRNIDYVFAYVCWAGFEEEDVDVRVFGQSVRHCESGWSAADDNVVVRCQ